MSDIKEKSTAVVTDAPATPETLSVKDEPVAAVEGEVDSPARPPSMMSSNEVPIKWKIAAIILVTGIGFGSNWSSGVTGAMKTTLKKVQYTPRRYHPGNRTNIICRSSKSTTPSSHFLAPARIS